MATACTGEPFGGGDRLILRPEPHNPHDEFAVEVYRGQRKLGYLPRTENAHVSRLLGHGGTVFAELADVDTSLYFEEIAILVWLEESGDIKERLAAARLDVEHVAEEVLLPEVVFALCLRQIKEGLLLHSAAQFQVIECVLVGFQVDDLDAGCAAGTGKTVDDRAVLLGCVEIVTVDLLWRPGFPPLYRYVNANRETALRAAAVLDALNKADEARQAEEAEVDAAAQDAKRIQPGESELVH